MTVTKWWEISPTCDQVGNPLSNIGSHLFCGRGDARNGFAVWHRNARRVTDYEDMGRARNRKIFINFDAPDTVGSRLEPGCGGRCLHAGGPDHGFCVEPLVTCANA